jgi:phage shock protein A
MRESVREIDRATDDVRAELGRVMADHHRTTRIIAKLEEKHAELAERAGIAVKEGRDDLASAALGRQVDIETEIPKHQKSLADLATRRVELEGYVAALAARKQEMERDLADFLTARTVADDVAGVDGPAMNAASRAERRADKAREAFDRVLNGGAGAPSRPDRDTAVKLNELERLARSSKIADRLNGLKKGGNAA